jgi:hypothetical protein
MTIKQRQRSHRCILVVSIIKRPPYVKLTSARERQKKLVGGKPRPNLSKYPISNLSSSQYVMALSLAILYPVQDVHKTENKMGSLKTNAMVLASGIPTNVDIYFDAGIQ